MQLKVFMEFYSYIISISGSQATSDSLTDQDIGFFKYCAKGNYVYPMCVYHM